MEVLQGTTGAEVDAIKTVLERARVAAQEKLLTEQIAECKGFVEWAQRRLSKLEAEGDAENAVLEEGRARVARLQAQGATHTTASPPPPVTTNVSELEAEVSRLRAELAARSNPSRDSLKRQCRREEFVPQCDEEMVVGRTPRRSSDGSGDRTAPRGCKALSIDDNSCRGVASIDSKPENSSFSVGEHSEVTMLQWS